MKQILLFSFSFLLTSIVNSQNLLSNGDFEDCSSGCPYLRNSTYEGQFDLVNNWSEFGSYQAASTPDLWSNTITNQAWLGDVNIEAQSGTHYAAIYGKEGIYYDFGGGGIETSIYNMSLYIHGSEGNDNTVDNGFSVWLTTVPPSPLAGCTDFAGGDKYLLYKQKFPAYTGGWQKFEFIFPTYNGVVPYRYLVITGYGDDECSRYIYIDNVSVENDCCGEFMKYQHTDQLPKYTSRKEFIKAGYDVDCVWQPVGNVTVKSDQNVTFQSAGYIERLPGFNVELGGVFEEHIRDCGDVPENALNDTNLIYYPNAVFFTCDGKINNAGFSSTGFSYFRVRIFNRIGEKVFDVLGHIDEIYQVYTSGADIYTDISQGVFVVQIELFNCSYRKVEAFSLFYEYRDPCLSASFKKDLDMSIVLSSEELKNDDEVKIYPNPASDQINLCYTVQNDSSVSFAIHDAQGKLFYKNEHVPVLNQKQMHIIPTSELESGTYFLTLYKEGKKLIKKFIIQK